MNLVKPAPLDTLTDMRIIDTNFPAMDIEGRATSKDYIHLYRNIAIVIAVGVAFALFTILIGGGTLASVVLGVVYGIGSITAILISHWKLTVARSFKDAKNDDALFRRQGFCALYVHPLLAKHGLELYGMAAQCLIQGDTMIANGGQILRLRDNKLFVTETTNR